MLGIQGSGKGTQSQKIAKKYGMLHICVGDLLKEQIDRKTKIGLEYAKDYANGKLASPETVFKILGKKLNSKITNKKGFILDGFPRNSIQLDWFEKHYFVNKCIHLNITKREAIGRLSKRNREDDNEEGIKNRIATYYEHTVPIVTYYKNQGKAVEINGNQSIENTFSEIEEKLYLKK